MDLERSQTELNFLGGWNGFGIRDTRYEIRDTDNPGYSMRPLICQWILSYRIERSFEISHPVETGRRLLIVPFKINSSKKALLLFNIIIQIIQELMVEVGSRKEDVVPGFRGEGG